MLTEDEEKQIRTRLKDKYNHDDEYIDDYVERVKATRERNTTKKEAKGGSVCIDIDKLVADGEAQLIHEGIKCGAQFVELGSSRDVEDDPNFPDGRDGYTVKRPVPGYHYLTLKYKVLRD